MHFRQRYGNVSLLNIMTGAQKWSVRQWREANFPLSVAVAAPSFIFAENHFLGLSRPCITARKLWNNGQPPESRSENGKFSLICFARTMTAAPQIAATIFFLCVYHISSPFYIIFLLCSFFRVVLPAFCANNDWDRLSDETATNLNCDIHHSMNEVAEVWV